MSLWNFQTLSVIQRMLAIYSLVPLPFLNPADICNFLVRIMLQPSMKDFKYDLTSMGDQCNCLVVSTFFGTTLLGNWDEDWSFPEIPYLLDISTCPSKILFTIQLSALEVDLSAMLNHFSHVPLCDPMDCNLPGSSVHGILQARILEWIAMPSSRGSSWPRDQTRISQVSYIGKQFIHH